MRNHIGKNVVVTGGSSGIGLAIAGLLAAGGARVVITGRSQDALDAARERLGENAAAFRGDVSSLSDLDALADRVKGELGTVDALFVNAGVSLLTPFESTTEEVYDELFAVNVKGAFFTVQKLAPLLNAGAGVVLTTSVAGAVGMLDTSVYAAGKAALRSMARSLSRELLPRAIRVNAISPGPIDTGTLERSMTKEEAERFKAERVTDNPMRRFGTLTEIAVAAAFLAFDATYTAGVELAVDGGVTQL
ncbi:NAD(P)-dependent dehydrogenase (short-subunit alcohol dehydrogenase family) [Nonomuraea thailandensis]|uniref:NAD(P)-dependent dehydrogenase (Short-subunit alcohol dehydrogenase family) n=1 Tax=Nonomuraea thailandensis TaxID=1188745 RepID=A0A9X2GPB2_9ACTN|nr:SDR family oxidoreductase [Nonomuraea thailandensis]MCP2357988.1 NAD(P)-dependent dehydrogenase (short-subunit alcohol dehydrogenase family) [Nonomuraea thailandensis]